MKLSDLNPHDDLLPDEIIEARFAVTDMLKHSTHPVCVAATNLDNLARSMGVAVEYSEEYDEDEFY